MIIGQIAGKVKGFFEQNALFLVDHPRRLRQPAGMANQEAIRRQTRKWMKDNGVTYAALGERIGDPGCSQVGPWLSGRRRSLPIRLRAELAEQTGLPVKAYLDRDEAITVRKLVQCWARDAA